MLLCYMNILESGLAEPRNSYSCEWLRRKKGSPQRATE